MPESSPRAPVTYGFPTDGRSPEEVARMKEYGYGEDPEFARGYIREDGYFCGSCKAFKSVPGTHEGVCLKFNFRDRDYGCCAGWYK